MRKILFCCLIVLMVSSLQACTKAAWYEGMKEGQRTRCYKLPDSERADCLKQIDKSYNEYKREREESLKSSK